MPAGGALFGSSASGPGSTGGNKHLVEMRAGKMYMKGMLFRNYTPGTNKIPTSCFVIILRFIGRMVYPDKRKGLLYVYQSEDSLMHFCWQDRTSGNIQLFVLLLMIFC